MQNHILKKTKETTKEKKMAVLTAKCDNTFIVDKTQTQKFKDYRTNEKIIQKNKALTDKIVKKIESKDS